MTISEILTHLGEDREHYFQAVAPPVVQSSNFVFPDLAAFRAAFSDELAHHVYSRGNNPTVEILRKKLAALEGTEDCLAFASGAGAVAVKLCDAPLRSLTSVAVACTSAPSSRV